MKIATLYDIHGNLPALEAVLAEIAQENVDAIVVGGDAIGGPMPVEVIETLRSLPQPVHYIHGNGEAELLRHLAGIEINGLSARSDELLTPWIANQLSAEQQQFVRGWAANVLLQSPKLGRILFCHATPHNNTHVFTANTDQDKIEHIFDGVMADVVVCGHTHMQFDLKLENHRIVNSGSVGLPFGETGAFWLLIDDGIEFRRTEYDKEPAAERIRQTAYPVANETADGNVLTAPPREAALALFDKLIGAQTTTK